jgi:uncharacterized protein (TIGR03437 family)
MRVSIGLLLSVMTVCAAGPSATLASFPNTGVNAVQVDSAGNIYIAGFQGTVGSPATYDAFVAKLSPDGSQVLYSTKFAGSQSDFASVLGLDATGAAYIFGQTKSPDFPVTPGAMQSTMLAGNGQGFVAKVDPQGTVVYATFIGGSSSINPAGGGLVVDSLGDVYISGQYNGGTFPTTAGAVVASATPSAAFLMKLGPGGNLLAAVAGIGGQITLDAQGNLYVAGALYGEPTQIPITSGAFQSTFSLMACGGDAQVPEVCTYQYVTKLNPALTQVVYSTFVTGSYGAQPVAISVDAQGNVLVAGTTYSADYPATANAFQPFYVAAALPPGPSSFGPFSQSYPPPASGYLTKINATGTGLLYSTFFSGTEDDTISFAAVTSNGVYFSGQAGSPDLPGLDGAPLPCLPQSYVAGMSLDGTSITASRLLNGAVLAFDSVTGQFLAWTGTNLISFDSASPPNPITCILDSADSRPVTSIAPGELVSIYGPHFVQGPITGYSLDSLSTSLFGVGVTFNGIGGPILYLSNQQINLQAPYEIAGSAQVAVAITLMQGGAVAESITLPVVAAQPTAFLNPAPLYDLSGCPLSGIVYSGGPVALAFNSDGSQNSCFNPAPAGSTVTIFLQGLGVTGSAVTGGINASPGAPLTLPITTSNPYGGGPSGVTIVSANALPGSISGVWQVGLQVAPNNSGAFSFSMVVGIGGEPVQVRDTNLNIWIR